MFGPVLTSLDPGVGWVLSFIGVEQQPLCEALAAAFPRPSPRRVPKIARRRTRDLVRRHERLVGRNVINAEAIVSLIAE
ncbi:MAG: hypothetical protein ACRD0Z_04475 [Acidimicrobiales bacterium]